jgi:hypothetical protein
LATRSLWTRVALQWERSSSDVEQGGARREATSVARVVGGDEGRQGHISRGVGCDEGTLRALECGGGCDRVRRGGWVKAADGGGVGGRQWAGGRHWGGGVRRCGGGGGGVRWWGEGEGGETAGVERSGGSCASPRIRSNATTRSPARWDARWDGGLHDGTMGLRSTRKSLGRTNRCHRRAGMPFI